MKKLVVVGIGSSAGGLEALQILFSSIDNIDNIAFIVAQHLSPTHKSMMVDLLSRVSNIPVLEAKNGMVIRAKTIYITPENTDIYVKNHKIYLKNIHHTFGPKPSVNYFLTSLAEDFGERAFGIILSGTGSDGAFGIRAIKAEGGITFAQTPSTAKYDGMPLSAISTGKVDIVSPIDKMGEEVTRLSKEIDEKRENHLNESMMQKINRLIFEEKGVDFSQYKKNTIQRRLARRMTALKIDSLASYIDLLEMDDSEVHNLYNDILIGVTTFFRDKEPFTALREQLEMLLSKKEYGEEIRIWSIGTSTGEEAYSLAIIVADILGDKLNRYRVKIFATDIDDEALKIARAGIYSEASLVDVDKSIINRYFTVLKHQYEVKKSIREMVVFARHNIASDSPFLRMDLITCRNLMIYFDAQLQYQLFPIMHYAMNENALLMLGKSETIGSFGNLFVTIDKTCKIYKAQYTGQKEAPRIYTTATYKPFEADHSTTRKNDNEVMEDYIDQAASDFMLNQSVVINSSNEIVYIKGENPYLKFAQGKTSLNIFKIVHDELVLDLRTKLHEAQKSHKIQITRFQEVRLFEELQRYVRVIIMPIRDQLTENDFYVLFFQTEKRETMQGYLALDGDDTNKQINQKLKDELEATKAHLQNVIEELETSYEEAQSLNEELQSSNEELQSSNEELETTNEELQSTNEELQTAYAELKSLYEDKERRAKQLESLTDDLKARTEELRSKNELVEGVIDNTPVAITMVDRDGHIIFANDHALKLFKITRQQLTARSYDDASWQISTFDDQPFPEAELPFSIIKRTFEPVQDIRHAITIDGEKFYLAISGAPQFDAQGRFSGAVFTIEDLTRSMLDKSALETIEMQLSQANDDKTALMRERMNDLANSKNILHDEFIQMLVMEMGTTWRNQINRLSITSAMLAQQLPQDESTQTLLTQFNNDIAHVTEELDRLNLHYSQTFISKSVELSEVFSWAASLFETLLNSMDITFEVSIDTSLQIKLPILSVKALALSIFEHLARIILQYGGNDAGKVTVASDNETLELTITLSGVKTDSIDPSDLLKPSDGANTATLHGLNEKLSDLLGSELVPRVDQQSLIITFGLGHARQS
jgi:two-component system CheB/CheR fusion protein